MRFIIEKALQRRAVADERGTKPAIGMRQKESAATAHRALSHGQHAEVITRK
jgi:hypothetical protein